MSAPAAVCDARRAINSSGEKPTSAKAVKEFVGGVNRLRDDKIGGWYFRLWTSNNEFDLRRAWTDCKTEGSSELNTVRIMLFEH